MTQDVSLQWCFVSNLLQGIMTAPWLTVNFLIFQISLNISTEKNYNYARNRHTSMTRSSRARIFLYAAASFLADSASSRAFDSRWISRSFWSLSFLSWSFSRCSSSRLQHVLICCNQRMNGCYCWLSRLTECGRMTVWQRKVVQIRVHIH